MGTPLSDATEERQWRKLVHRATNQRSCATGSTSRRPRTSAGCAEGRKRPSCTSSVAGRRHH
eukprot:1366900-Prymnesium_polylepis.1